MEARPSQIFDFFNGTKQMVVPLFQRPYEWQKKHWEALWSDILEQYEVEEGSSTSHFTGAIVTAPARSVPVGVSKHLVIDGQQRLTTIAIIICALRSSFPEDSKDYRRLSRLLINEDEDGLDYLKILPTQLDRPAFQKLIGGTPEQESQVGLAHEFFREKIDGKDSDGSDIDAQKLARTLQTTLSVVAIHLGDDDDPYLIFESLNGKGAALTQADLIRNYLLLRIRADAQEQIYQNLWLPMQELLSTGQLTEFMRQYLMQDGNNVVKSAIYAALKNRLSQTPDNQIPDAIARMNQSSQLYAQTIGLQPHPNAKIEGALHRLRRWEVTTANPLILKLLASLLEGELQESDVIDSLVHIESFVVRRAICNVPTNQLNKIFLAITKELPAKQVSSWLATRLGSGASGRRWPKDDEVLNKLEHYRAYSRRLDRCRLILERIEISHSHKERPSFEKATIEHIMPRTLSPEWRQSLGEDVESIYDKWLDTLPNLTLSGYNSELSNLPFEKKKELLKSSNFEMNRWVIEQNAWGEAELKKRMNTLFERVQTIWPGPPETVS